MILFKAPSKAPAFAGPKESYNSIRAEIIDRCGPESVLILVPTKRKIRSLLREIIRMGSGRSRSFGRISIATIETMAFDLLRRQNVVFREISPAVSLVLHSQCYEENKEALKYFPKDEIPGGTLLKLKNVISEYKRHPLTPSELRREVEDKLLLNEGDELKVNDIILLYEAYNARCTSLALKEIGDIYTDLLALDTQQIKKGFSGCFPSVENIIVEGYDNLTRSEIELLDRLSLCFNVFIDFDYSDKNENLFGHLSGSMNTFTENYGWKELRGPGSEGGNELKKYIARWLSRVGAKKAEAFPGISVTEIEAPDRDKEVDLIAREIKHILFENSGEGKKTEPHEICVVFQNVSDYSAIVREKFESCGIPFNLTDRKLLSSSPPVLAVLNFIMIKADNFYYKDIMRALSSGYISIRKRNGRYVDFNNLLETAGKLKIVAGYDNWVSSLKEIIELIEEEARKKEGELMQEDAEAFYDEDYIRRLAKDKMKFIWALEDLEEIDRLLKPLGEMQTPLEFRNNLFDLIRDTGILYRTFGPLSREYFENKKTGPAVKTAGNETADDNKMQATDQEESYKFNLEENARGFDKFIETVTGLLDLIGSIGRGEKYELAFFIRQIKTSVMRERYNLTQRSNYGVMITSPGELRGLQFDTLFIGGLIDNCFPSPYRPEIFVVDSKKRENGKMSKPELHQTEERYLFYQSLSSFRSRLYLTYPAGENNKQFEKSVFLKELENIITINKKNESDYSEYLYTAQHVLKGLSINRRFYLPGPEGLKECDDMLRAADVMIKSSVVKDAMLIDSERISPGCRQTRFTGELNNPEDPLKNVRQEEFHGRDAEEPEIFSRQTAENLSSYSSRTYSVSQLEVYARCPFQYFSSRVLSLGTIEHPREEIESNELGTLIHKIFCEFYRSFGAGRKVTQENSQEAFDLIRSVAERHSQNYFKSPLDFYEKEKLFGINGRQEESILYRFIQTEAEDDSGFIPWKFEKSFGYEDDPESPSFVLNGVKLRGQIDRIDINPETKKFRVIDYKLSGAAPSGTDLKEGVSLQLPVYLHVAKKIIEEEPGLEGAADYQPDTAIIYSLKIKAGEFKMKKVISYKQKSIPPEEAMKVSSEKVAEYIKGISAGSFHMSPDKKKTKVCSYCDYSNICRI